MSQGASNETLDGTWVKMVKDAGNSEMRFSELAARYKALGDETRLALLAYLKVRTLCVCELVPLLGVSQSAVSQHLRRLKEAGWVVSERRGQWVYYSLNETMVKVYPSIIAALPDMSDEILKLEQEDNKLQCKL